MGAIPLHLQRKLEQRWAARFASPVASAAPKSADLKGTVNSLPRLAKAKPAELSSNLLEANARVGQSRTRTVPQR
jgi:hypothetical protein